MILTISQLANQAQVKVSTIRFYERKKLLLPSKRTESGYRHYDENSVAIIHFIRNAQQLGFTLMKSVNCWHYRMMPQPVAKPSSRGRLKNCKR